VKYVFLGFLIGGVGFVDYLIKFGAALYPFGFLAAILFASSITYAILRYQLLEIEVFVGKTLVFAGLSAFAFGIFVLTTYLTQEFLSAYAGGGRLISLAVSIFFIVLGYDPLRKYLIHVTDRFLFQKKYDYRKFLQDASTGLSQIEGLEHLLRLVIHFITMRVRLKNAAILLRDEKLRYFQFAFSRGYPASGSPPAGYVLYENDPLVEFLTREHAALDLERVNEFLQRGGSIPKKEGMAENYDFQAIKRRMEELRAACCIPSFLTGELRNVLVLGEKKSGEIYTDEDLSVLFTLAQESAIAIENARLYDQAVEKAKELEQINQQLATAQTNLLKALSETEIANKRLRDTHVQLIHEQKMATLGRLASSVGHEVNNPLTILSMNVSRAILKHRRDPDLKVSEIIDVFQKMEQNISRIKAVVNTLTGLLKKSEHGKFEPLSLKLVLEETLPLVQFQTYLENLTGTEVLFDVPANLPLIKGDLERLQEVFLNLFINAYHAMMGKRDRRISVTARESAANPGMVLIEFSDNGCGMNDEVMKKIFSYGFTTKPAGKGSGMGLYMCRYIIELHGGEVKLRSKLGEGTTFLITLPIYQEESAFESGTASLPANLA
jgi:signal transduction histidine kinase